MGTFGFLGLLAPLIAPYDPHAISGASLLSPSLHHLLGTNDLGQDVLSQLLFGARESLLVALAASSLGTVVGVVLGAWAGLRGGAIDVVAMRTVDVALAMPALPLLIVVAALAGPNDLVVVLAVASVTWPPIARIVRGQVLSLRSRGFVGAARGFGGGSLYVTRRHVAPAAGPLIASQFVDVAGTAIVLYSGLAFLGLANASTSSWGGILNRAATYPGIYDSLAWTWWLVPAGLSITLAVLGFALLGLGMEPGFNPRWARFS